MTTIQHRRGTTAQWTAANPILKSGEPAYDQDVKRQKIGDGVTRYLDLPYFDELEAETELGVLTPLQQHFTGVRPQTSVPSAKVDVSLTANAWDGDITGIHAFQPQAMYDKANVSWTDETLGAYGAAFLNYSKANSMATPFDFELIFEGTWMYVGWFKASGIPNDVRVWIDDEEVDRWYDGTRAAGTLKENDPLMRMTHTDGVFEHVNLNFKKYGIYKVRISGVVISGNNGLIGTNANGKFSKPLRKRTFGVISDSWYDSIPAHTSLVAGDELAARMGWNWWNFANGGTGFVNPGGASYNYGSDAVFASLAEAPELDLLIVNGSVNDMGYDEAAVLQAMRDFFTRWRTVRPDTPIVWQGLEPQSYFENIYGAPAIVAREEAQATEALADPSVIGVIRSAAENWLTGTGNTSAPNGSGNQDWVTGSDAVHLSMYGTYWNGAKVFERLGVMKTWRS